MIGNFDLPFFSFMIVTGIIGFLVAIILFGFWIWMIVDCAGRKFKKRNLEKIVWILIIVFTGWIGALVYFIVIKTMNPRGIS